MLSTEKNKLASSYLGTFKIVEHQHLKGNELRQPDKLAKYQHSNSALQFACFDHVLEHNY